MQNQKLIKRIIIGLIVLVVIIGMYFGFTFYQASQNIRTQTSTTNTNPNRTPFQTRVASGTDITIVNNPANKEETLNPATSTPNTTPLVAPRLMQLWKEPVSGFDFIVKDLEVEIPVTTLTIDESSSTGRTRKVVLKDQLYVYLWDRSTGNIYHNLASSTVVERLSNYTLPRIEEATFVDPLTVSTRGLDANNETIVTSYIKLYKETATSTLFTFDKKDLSVNTEHISISKDTKKAFYFLKNTGQAFVANLDLSSTLKVLTTSLMEWIPQYVNRTTLAATTKPSAYFQGYLFFINSAGNQDNQYILGNKYGFTTLVSPDGTKVLYSEILNDLLQTSIYDIRTKKSIPLSQSTITDKCTWSTDSSKIYCAISQQLPLAPYPDVWYQGNTKFSDNIWTINPQTGQFTITIPLQDQVPQPIDAYNMKVSSNGKYLIFQDKYTLTLWKYSL